MSVAKLKLTNRSQRCGFGLKIEELLNSRRNVVLQRFMRYGNESDRIESPRVDSSLLLKECARDT